MASTAFTLPPLTEEFLLLLAPVWYITAFPAVALLSLMTWPVLVFLVEARGEEPVGPFLLSGFLVVLYSP